MNEKLIFDIGFHKGEDTKYYLSQGYKVVAVEANPLLADAGRQRFGKFIERGDLVLLNVGIAQQEGVLDFWINEALSEWSSFDRETGCRQGTPCRSIQVQCISTRNLIEQFGTPYYIKVDIEGFDLYALMTIDIDSRPKYVSCEATGLQLIEKMSELGYTKFKMINQAARFSAIDINKERSRFVIYKRNVVLGFMRRTEQFVDWNFPFKSSGPFGEKTDGRWMSAAEITELFRAFYQFELNVPLNPYSWFDFHATFD